MDPEGAVKANRSDFHLFWKSLFENNALDSSHFRKYWRDEVPKLFSPRPNALVPIYDEETVKRILFDPLEQFILDGEHSTVLERLREAERPPTLCGRVFKMGEPTYSCRDCGMDPTCVLCVDCFKTSLHRNHRYKMSTSCGGGYCDCGDLEAWKFSPFCDRHAPLSTTDVEQSPLDRLSQPMVARARMVFEYVLEYCYQILCWEESIKLPEDLKSVGATDVSSTYATMLFNDEIHTYEQVIRTLSRAIGCSQKEAIDFATTVDRDGRSIVKCGTFESCKEVKGFVERITSQHGPKPLRVVVMDPGVVAHQNYALKLLAWFQQLISGSQAFRVLFSEVVSAQRRDERSILEGVIRSDTRLWKTARSQWHQLFISGMLMEQESKRTFARVFTKNYPSLMKDFIEDDHDHSLSITSLSVQIFTVPTLAHMLIVEEDVLAVVLRTFCTECEAKLNSAGKLAFERNHSSANFRRAQFILFDLKYLLISKPDVWENPMRKNFLHGVSLLLKLLSWMQGMDMTVRQVGQHMEFEPDWESVFNLHIKLSPVITLVLEWCGTDRVVLVKAYRATLKNLGILLGSPPRVNHEVADHNVTCINYDVSSQPLSIHLPLTRLLAGLHLHLDSFQLDFNSSEFSVDDKPSPMLLMELPLRTQVMIAQVHAGMWRRNGYSLLNQIYFYRNVRCRSEMYDRDIAMLQIGASLVESNEFLIHLLNKFGLMNWVREDYEMGFPKAEEDSVRQIITLVEEFLGLVLVVVAERHVPGLGMVSYDDCIRKEIIQQLCIEPMAHSHLSKTLPEDANHETGMEAVIEQVATFKKPLGSGKGIYEINAECYAEYNPFFYHYTREEQSKAEEAQRKRKKQVEENECCPPPVPPPFWHGFASVPNILNCDVMLHVMRIVLERNLNLRARSYSDGQSLKLLHLIGYALYEEQRSVESGDAKFRFTCRSAKENILVLLEALTSGSSQRRDVHKDLLNWVLQKFRQVQKLSVERSCSMGGSEASSSTADAAMDTSELPDDNDKLKTADVVREEKKKRAEMAAARRNRIMAQMSAMQKNFIREHAELFEKSESEPGLSNSLMDLTDISAMEGPPICVGLNQTSRQWIPNRHICILCQEDQNVTLGGRAMVYSALVQRSTVLSRSRGKFLEDSDEYDPLLAPSDLFCAPHTSTCGHVMHADCWQKYFDSVLAKERRRPIRARHHLSFDVDKQEFLCPLCECLSNTVIPIVPAIGTILPELSDRKVDLSMDDWIGILRIVVNNAQEVKKAVEDQAEPLVDAIQIGIDGQPKADESETRTTKTEIKLCTLDELAHHLDSNLSHKLSCLYPEVSKDSESSSSSSAVSSSLAEMMSFYATATYTIGLGLNPHPENERVPLMSWYSCAYTIHSIENLLRDQGKPLFGELSSRQSDCLSALVRLSAISGTVSEYSTLEGHCYRLLSALLGDGTSTLCLVDIDAFGVLVALVLLLPCCVDFKDGLSVSERVPHGDVRDYFALHLLYVLHLVQILMSADLSDVLSAPMEEDGMEGVGINDEGKSAKALLDLYGYISQALNRPSMSDSDVNGERLLGMVQHQSTPFLRCCAIFFHYITGVPIPQDLQEVSDDTFTILCRYLGLSTDFSKILSSVELSCLIKLWLSHSDLAARQRVAVVQRPLVVNCLIELPTDYSELINDASLFTCPNSDGEDSRTPTMCLVCGKMLCSQSYCCQTELDGVLVGACTNHAHYCGAGVGIFLRVRECKVLLLAGKTKGCFVSPPYLDEYGETDQGLRRGNPLHLCHENYRKLQKLWLSHGIPEEIAHSLESNTHILTIEWQHL